MEKGAIKNIIFCAFALIGAVIGAGFATGAEIAVYFTSYGRMAVVFILLSVIFIALLYYYIVAYCKKRGIEDIRQLCNYTIPKRGDILYYVILSGAIVSCGAMLSSSGSLFYEFLGIPRWIVSAITGITGMFVVLKGIDGIGVVNKWIVPAAIGFNILLFLCVPKALYVNELDASLISGIVSSGIYAIFNMALSLGLVVSLGAKASLKQHRGVAILVSSILLLLMFMIHSVLSGAEDSFGKTQIPLLPVVIKWSAVAVYIYVWVLMGAIFTTYIASLYNFVPLCKGKKLKILIFSATAVSFLMSFIKLRSIVKYIYPLSGISCIILVIAMILKNKKSNGRSVNEVLRSGSLRPRGNSGQGTKTNGNR